MISVLLPVRNGRPFLDLAISSVLACDDVSELLVQDACSTDGTLDVLSGFGDHRLSVVSEPDHGQADALNRALDRASQPWLLWLNADDLVSASALTHLAAVARGSGAEVVYGDFELIRSDGTSIRVCRAAERIDPLRVLNRGISLFSGSMLIRRDTCIAAGAFDSTLAYCMDYDLVLRLALRGPFEYVPGVAAALRMHPASKSISSPWGFFTEHKIVQDRYRAQIPGSKLVRLGLSRATMAARVATTGLRYSRLYSALRTEKRI